MAKRADTAMKTCRHHGDVEFVHDGSVYRCRPCRSEKISRVRKRRKELLVKMFGGKCVLCDYRRCIGALKFHHVDPSTKEFRLGQGATRALEKDIAEAKKCVLLCGNCHDEFHDGLHEQKLIEELHQEVLRNLEL